MTEDNFTHVFQVQLGVDLGKILSLEKIEGLKQLLEVDSDEEVTEAYLKFILEKVESAVSKQGFIVVDGRMIDLNQMKTQEQNLNEQSVVEESESTMIDSTESKESETVISDNQLELLNQLKAVDFEVVAGGGTITEIRINPHYQIDPEDVKQTLDSDKDVNIIISDMEHDWEIGYLDIHENLCIKHSHEELPEED